MNHLEKNQKEQFFQAKANNDTFVTIRYSQDQLRIVSTNEESTYRLSLQLKICWIVEEGIPTGFILDHVEYTSRPLYIEEFKNFIKGFVMFDNLHEFYSMVKNIGHGGQSEGVFEVMNIFTKKSFALKQIKKSSQSVHKVYEEITTLKQLNSEHIVQLIECFESDHHIYIIMERLQELTVAWHDEQLLKTQLKQILLAIKYINSCGYIHRDIKINNLMMDQNGTIKIIDFGLCTQIRKSPLKRRRQCGTPGYIAPEVLNSFHYDEKCDMFSVGVIMFELFTRKHLILGSDKLAIIENNKNMVFNRNLVQNLSDSGIDLMEQLLEKNPKLRISVDNALKHEFFDDETMTSRIMLMNPKFMKFINSHNYRKIIQFVSFLSSLAGNKRITSSHNLQKLFILMFECFYSYQNGIKTRISYNKKTLKLDSEQQNLSLKIDLKLKIEWITSNNQYLGFKVSELKYQADHDDLVLFKQSLKCQILFENFNSAYKLQDKIGEGLCCEGVYEVINRLNHRKYAVKIVSKQAMKKVLKEIKILSSLKHQNVVQLKELYDGEENIYIVMERLYVLKIPKQDEVILQKVMIQVLLGIEYIHKFGIIHTDLTLENIMMNEKKQIKIIDFSHAKAFNLKKSLTGKRGTLGYIAPEIVNYDEYDEKCDIFSAGVIMFEIFHGYQLFEGETKQKVLSLNQQDSIDFDRCEGMSESARDLISYMLQVDPNLRFSAEQALDHEFFDQRPSQEFSAEPKFISYIRNKTQ
ncbi:hypothetical protein pb186bvf_015118 [Paramecium bursaria]